MRSRLFGAVLAFVWLIIGAGSNAARAADTSIGRYFYYPYYYFPHNYWPSMGPQWPERPGMPYMPPPAYMAYPAFREPMWRYEMFEPQRYHRGFHFWLDQF
jgi:hypothetical protein